MSKKLAKIQCEICGETNSKILHKHHLVERTELHTDNSEWNLAVICPSCHSKFHAGFIKIIGVFPSTKPPGRILVYINENGVCNVPALKDSKPYYTPKPQEMKYEPK